MTSTRLLTVSFSPSLEICQHLLNHGPVEAMVSIDVGGSPFEFNGPIVLDGSRPNTIQYESGDSIQFWIELLPENRLAFRLQSGKEHQSERPPLISIEPVELSCK